MKVVIGIWHCYRVDLGGCRGIARSRTYFFHAGQGTPSRFQKDGVEGVLHDYDNSKGVEVGNSYAFTGFQKIGVYKGTPQVTFQNNHQDGLVCVDVTEADEGESVVADAVAVVVPVEAETVPGVAPVDGQSSQFQKAQEADLVLSRTHILKCTVPAVRSAQNTRKRKSMKAFMLVQFRNCVL